MRIQTQPNGWSCLPVAFAMVLDVPYQEILGFCGHDGSEIMFPDSADPHCRRAFHAQEMLTFALHSGRFVTPIEMRPNSMNKFGSTFVLPEQGLYIRDYMSLYTGVIVGYMRGNPHAVAWDGNLIYDPNGTSYKMSDKISTEIFFACNSNM